MTPVFAIHGAWSTGDGFTFVRQHIPNIRYFSYDCNHESIRSIVKRAKKELVDMGEPSTVLGHSLGGLIALALHDETNCNSIITMSTPLAGIRIHPLWDDIVSLRLPILRSIEEESDFIARIHDATYTKRIKNFISTYGFNPLVFDKSDGIVTIRSQTGWKPPNASQVFLKCNHFEILHRHEVVNAIIEFTDCTG